jgi:L-aspartate oxidase
MLRQDVAIAAQIKPGPGSTQARSNPSQVPTMPNLHQHDVLILGSGAAGLTLALQLGADISVAVVSKRELAEGSTLYAQGGISAVMDRQDTVESHVRDTLKAGAGLCDARVVRLVVEHGPGAIR